tara:strand:+ start:726 stop:1025 length:300 start_codon:yes stop_codon:yes gene_type:complete
VLKVSEVYEQQFKTKNERPDGSEYVSYDNRFTTRDCLVNEDYIVAVMPHEYRSDIVERKMQECFPQGTRFSTLVLDGNSFRKSELLVVGSFEKFCELLD